LRRSATICKARCHRLHAVVRSQPKRRQMVEATEEYFEAEDALGRWLEECCVREPNAKSLTAELFKR